MKKITSVTCKKILLIVVTTTIISCSDSGHLETLDTDSVVLAFGDSLTYGTGTSRDNAYPAVLQQLIGHKVINAGIPGEISAKGLSRLPALLRQYQPDLIIICHGANDILRKLDLAQTSDNIQGMIDLARQNGSQVVLIGVPEFGLFLNTSPMYEALADSNHIPIETDVLGQIIANNTLKSDHVHPNTKGYRLLAETIASLLRNTGAIPAI